MVFDSKCCVLRHCLVGCSQTKSSKLDYIYFLDRYTIWKYSSSMRCEVACQTNGRSNFCWVTASKANACLISFLILGSMQMMRLLLNVLIVTHPPGITGPYRRRDAFLTIHSSRQLDKTAILNDTKWVIQFLVFIRVNLGVGNGRNPFHFPLFYSTPQ